MNLILENTDFESLLFIHEDVGDPGLRTQRSELEIRSLLKLFSLVLLSSR